MSQLNNERGSALTIVSIIVSLLLISSTFLLSTYAKGSQTVYSQEMLMKSNYLAESGLTEAIDHIVLNLPPITAKQEKCSSENGKDKNKKTCLDDKGNGIPNPHYEHPACKKEKPGKESQACKKNAIASEPSTTEKKETPSRIIPSCRTASKQHNPSCLKSTPQQWSTDFFVEKKEMAFSKTYHQKAKASWFAEGIVSEGLYYIQATGIYGQAETTLEAGIYIDENQMVTIQFMQEI